MIRIMLAKKALKEQSSGSSPDLVFDVFIVLA
jgi:hypothetical protein